MQETEWGRKLAKCPERHVARVGSATGEQWRKALWQVKVMIGNGILVGLIGARGTGKTQLVVELAYQLINEAVSHHLEKPKYFLPLGFTPARYCKAIDFFMDLRATFNKKSKMTDREIVADYCSPRLLILDEIGVRGETKWEDDVFTKLIDDRYDQRKDTILIGNMTPAELAASIGPSIASRMQETGGTLECKWESYRA